MLLGSIRAPPRGRHGKNFKKSSSPKPQGPELSYFVCNKCMMVLFINPAYRAPGVQTGPAPGVSWEKHKKNLLLQNHKAQSFHILYVAMSSGPLYCYVPGVTRRLRKPTSWLASNKLCLKFNKSI